MTKKQVDSIFKEEYADFIVKCEREHDKVAYNDFMGYMCKSGHITDRQYNSLTCPFRLVAE